MPECKLIITFLINHEKVYIITVIWEKNAFFMNLHPTNSKSFENNEFT